MSVFHWGRRGGVVLAPAVPSVFVLIDPLACPKMMAADGWYTFTGREGEVIPLNATRVRIDESLTVIPALSFSGHPSIEEVDCHDRVKTVKEHAFFYYCRSLRRVIILGVKVVEWEAFYCCAALTDVECGKLEIIGRCAFGGCESLGSIILPSAKIVEGNAFSGCEALMNIEFGKELESIGQLAFLGCTSLERITIPLKDGIITDDDTFQGCKNLKHVELVGGGGVHETIAALLLEEWINDMNEEIISINQILLTTPAGDDVDDVGGKAQAVRMWTRSVLRKIIHYKAEHQRYLNEAAFTLQLALPQDIMVNNVLPFLELPNISFSIHR
eukprot:scaffold7499_cov81-Skeletonema_dohrnii-CCMP3373.AAC.3